MADINQQQQEEPPQINGVLDGLTEEEKSKMRPADIDADMREMERRKRVEMMMNSRLFREELERIIETQMKDGSGPSGLLQQISEMMGPQGARFNTNVFKNSNCVVPINDIRGLDRMGYSKDEKLLRCKLAAIFRLLDLYGWTQGVRGMITARLNQDQEHFLVNPYGLLYHEVTASSLVKVDMQGLVVEQGTTNFGIHIANYQLHTSIHAARPDVKCIVHIATPSVTAISSMKCGLLPLGQESVVIGEVSSHQYINNSNIDPEEREKLSRNFGPINKVMLLTNQGALCCGETVEEAFYNVYNTVLACETQLKLMPVGIDNLSLLSDESRKAIYESSRKPPVPVPTNVTERSPIAEKLQKKRWRIGGTEFEALMRMLDNAGFRTGYIYRHPLVKSEPPRPRNDVEVPPAVCSLNYLLDDAELFRQGLWKGDRKGTDRTRWLNSPNVYQKVEILETGTPDPKKITKWVSDGSPTHSSTPVKIDGALQFVPKNTNPKEFKQLQQQIKDYRRADKISAGPQSHILGGVTWEEAKKMQDATISGTGEQVVLVGAASKGIIQRGFQHNAMVYKTPYAKNPFDAITDQELDQYKKEIERKTKGDPYDESQSESEALSSFNISHVTHESSTAKSPIQSPVSVTSETEEESRDEPKVLRIETKQVPAPSQPEVVLSDELLVELLVSENRVTWREDIKSKSLNAQHATNFNKVTVGFLNELSRSEMMFNNNTNGRGLSGVSRFSSSRSNTSCEDLESWMGDYEVCRLKTARAQEFARPMKVIMKEIQKAYTISRKRKRDFFNNYESRLRHDKEVQSLKNPNGNIFYYKNNFPNSESNRPKKSGIRKLVHNKIETEGNYVDFIKNQDMDFTEKVNLEPDFSSICKNQIYKRDEKSSIITQPFINQEERNQSDNTLNNAEGSLDNTLKILSDNEVKNKQQQTKDLEYIDFLNDVKDTNIYINEVEFCVCNDCNQKDNTNLGINSNYCSNYSNESEFKTQNNNKMKIINHESIIKNNSSFDRSKEETINYINEVEFFVDNHSSCFNNEIKKKNSAHDVICISRDDKRKGNFIINDEKCTFENFYLLTTIDSFNDSNRDKCFDEKVKIQENSHIDNRFISSDITVIEANDMEICKDKIVSNGPNLYILEESINNNNTKASTTETLNNSINNSHKEYSNKIGNVCISLNKDSISFLNYELDQLPNSLDFTYSEIEKPSEDFSPASTTRESFFCDDDLIMKRITRRDSIAEVASSINADIKPSNKVIVDMLAGTENSIKYNLDSQNMSLIYSITPNNDISDSSKNTTIEDLLEDMKNDLVILENINDNIDMIRVNTLNNIEKDIPNMNKTIELSEASFVSNISNQGSDLLELPSHTYLDLQKSSDEIFQKNMSTSVNQIINELNNAELYVNAANFVDEIIYDVACLNLPRDMSNISKQDLNNFVQEKIWALNLSKKIVKEIVGNLQCYDADKSTNSKVSNNGESSHIESLDQRVYVIREVIYHLVDKENLGKCDLKYKKIITDKKAKESINIELKSLKDDYDDTDENNLKCSTPKISLSPNRSMNNSFSEDEIILNVDNNDDIPIIEKGATLNSERQRNSYVLFSSNSSPSTESQNFAEQEVTSESTDNDTKSDNSKEKQTKIVAETKSSSPIVEEKFFSDFSLTRTYIETNEPMQLDTTSTTLSFCVIECCNVRNENYDSTSNIKFESKGDIETDSNETITNFMENFMDCEEEINQLWRLNEEKLEDLYAAERLDEIINIEEDEVKAISSEIKGQSTSYAYNVECCNEITDTYRRFESVEECNSFLYLLGTIKNENEESMLLMDEENEFESTNARLLKTIVEPKNYLTKLPPIDEVAEVNSSFNDYVEDINDTKTPEFHSCQNSLSNKSCDEQETINSNYNISLDQNSDYDKAYNADISANGASSDCSTPGYRTESTVSEDVKVINNRDGDVTENFADVSNMSLMNNNSDIVTLEYMTYSYDTNEFIKMELACKNNSEFSDIA